jgi:hypothetical protein
MSSNRNFVKPFLALSWLAAVLGSCLASAAEPNATLQQVRGSVRVQDEAGSRAGANTTRLAAGSRVVAASRSSAQLQYDDSCNVAVEPGEFAIVGQRSPCACTAASNGDGTAVPPSGDALLRELSGDVKVNGGRAFEAGREGQQVRSGNRIMLGGGSRAVLEFLDGCRIELDADKLVEVPQFSPCVCGVLAQQNLAPANAAALGSAPAGVTPGLPLIAGAVVVGVVLNNSDGSPVVIELPDDEEEEEEEEEESP